MAETTRMIPFNLILLRLSFDPLFIRVSMCVQVHRSIWGRNCVLSMSAGAASSQRSIQPWMITSYSLDRSVLMLCTLGRLECPLQLLHHAIGRIIKGLDTNAFKIRLNRACIPSTDSWDIYSTQDHKMRFSQLFPVEP